MTQELISLFLGTGIGALTKVIGLFVSSSIELNKSNLTSQVQKQAVADASHAKASERGGTWVRRMIVCVCLTGVVVMPFFMAFSDGGVTVNVEKSFLFFKWDAWKTLGGYVILPEVRTTLIAIVGYYFGSTSIK